MRNNILLDAFALFGVGTYGYEHPASGHHFGTTATKGVSFAINFTEPCHVAHALN